MTKAGMSKRVSDLEREASLFKNRLKKTESFDGSRIFRSGNSRVKVTVYQIETKFRLYVALGIEALLSSQVTVSKRLQGVMQAPAALKAL